MTAGEAWFPTAQTETFLQRLFNSHNDMVFYTTNNDYVPAVVKLITTGKT